jgi:hypothetical protein
VAGTRAAGALTAAALAAAALSACGGDHHPPRTLPAPHGPTPAETVGQGLRRSLDLATRKGCRDTRAIFHSSVPRVSPRNCNAEFAVLHGTAAGSVTRYGSGGLALYPRIGSVVLVLDRDRRFRVAVVVQSSQGSGSGPTAGSDRAAAHATEVLSKGFCNSGDPVFTTYKHQCDRRSLKVLAADLHGEVPRPTRLGGSFDTAFYGLRLRNGHYYTLVLFGASDLPGDQWNLLDAYRAQ